jgi:hypothetical protein
LRFWAEDAERKTTAKTTAIESVALPAGFAPAFGIPKARQGNGKSKSESKGKGNGKGGRGVG